MNILVSKVNQALRDNGYKKLTTLFTYDHTYNEECDELCDYNKQFNVHDYIYHALKENNIELIKALKTIFSEKEFNMDIKINAVNIFAYYSFYDKQRLDISIKDSIMEELFNNLIESKEDYALEQTTDIFGEPFIIKAMNCEPVFRKLVEKWDTEEFFKHLKFKKISKQFIDFFMKASEASIGERCLIVKNNAPELFEKIREDLKAKGKWEHTKYTDPLLTFFLSDYDLLKKEMECDINQNKNLKRKLVKF